MKEKLIDTYFSLTGQYSKKYGEKTILLMRVGAFFEVYGKKHKLFGNTLLGSKIDDFCSICELNKSTKAKISVEHKYNDTKVICNVVMAGFGHYVIEKYIDKLTNKGYTIVVYDQKKEDVTQRYLAGIYTPGTEISDDSGIMNNNIMCIVLYHAKPSKFNIHNEMHYGISTIDVLTGSTYVCEVSEQYYNSLTTYDELEKYYSIYNPNETIICYDSNNIKSDIIDGISNYVGIKSKLVRKVDSSSETPLGIISENCSKQKYQSEILNKHFNTSDYEELSQNIMTSMCGMHSFCFLIDYTSTYNQNLTSKIRIPSFEAPTNKLILANHSLKQLNILPLTKSEGKLSSVLDFVNDCKTAMGRRRIKQQLTSPITSVHELQQMYDLNEYCIENIEKYKPIQKELQNVFDIEKFYRKLVNKQIMPQDMYSFYKVVDVIKNILKLLKTETFLIDKKLFNLSSLNTSISKLSKTIKERFNIKVCSTIPNDQFSVNFFNKGISGDIDKCEEEFFDSLDNLSTILGIFDKMIKEKESKSKAGEYCKLHETDKSGYTIKITDTRGKKLVEAVKSYCKMNTDGIIKYQYKSSYDSETYESDTLIKELKTMKRGSDTLIIVPDCEHHMETLRKSKVELKKNVELEFYTFCDEFIGYQEHFETLISFVTNIDVLICKASIAIKYNYCKPSMNDHADSSYIEAKQMRHMLIEQINQQEIYVPNDVSLDNSQSGILLFGTNAVGKSSLIKSIGICVILAQSGFYVPCSEFIYKPFTQIFTRILGNDNIFKGLSTFAVEMSELRTILKNSDENSLVLGDELCSGTELGSAISIFVAGLQHLYKVKSKFIFATHFHEIKNMRELSELDSVHMKHMSVHYDAVIDGLVYDRIIRDGPGNNMYGLEVCKALNLPQEFIDMAYKIRDSNSKEDLPIGLQNTSKYNAKKVKGNCEMCNKVGVEVHHLQHQKYADDNGFIDGFHKNHIANLMNICEDCHDNIHKEDKQHVRKKTTKGYMILEK